MQINGDDAWVKLEVQTEVQPAESGDNAFIRLNDSLQDKIIELIENTAKTIMDYEANRT